MGSDAQELVLRITGNADGGKQAADAIKAKVNELVSSISGAKPSVADFGSQLKAALESPQDAAKTLLGHFSNMAPALGTVAVAAAGTATVAVGLSVALFELAENAASVGAHLDDMHQKTGSSVPELSRLSQAAQVAGTDIDALSNAVYKMDVQAADSPDKFAKGMEKLGLNTKQFLALDPTSRLSTLAQALNATADSSVRNAAGAEVMGKQYKELGPSLMKLGEALEKTSGISVWTEEQAHQAEEFEMQMKAIRLQVSDLGVSLGRELIPAALTWLQFLKDAKDFGEKAFDNSVFGKVLHVVAEEARYASAGLDLYRGSLNGLPATEDKAAQAVRQHAKDLQEWAANADRNKKAIEDMRKPTEGLSFSLADLDLAWKASTRDNTDAVEALKKSKAATEAWQKVLDEINSSGDSWVATLNAINPAVVAYGLQLLKAGVSLETVRKSQGLTETQAKALENQFKFLQTATSDTTKVFDVQNRILGPLSARYSDLHDTLVGVDHVTGDLAATVFDSGTATFEFADQAAYAREQTDKFRQALDETHRSAEAFKEGIADAFGGLPATIARAFEGGGGLTGAFESLGAQLGGVFTKKFSDSIHFGMSTDAQGKTTQSFMGSLGSSMLSGGIGAAIGLGINALTKFLSGIGGPSKDQLAARGAFGKQFDNVDDMIAATSARGAKAGMDGEVLRQLIQKVLDATHISASAENAALKTLEDALTSAEDKAKGLADALKAPDYKSLTESAAKYGITLEGLGPKFEQANITGQAQGILSDFEALKKAGADVGGVLLGMSDEISALVQNSIKFGTVLPAGMRDIIKNLIDAKKLTDDQGNAITDITQIQFDGSPTDEGLTKVQDNLQGAIDKAVGPGGVTDAVDAIGQAIRSQIPTNPFEAWRVPELNLPGVDWGGQQAAGGLYHVTRPTMFLAGERPGGETVAFSGIGKSLGGGITIHNHIAGSILSERELMRTVHDGLGDMFSHRYKMRAG